MEHYIAVSNDVDNHSCNELISYQKLQEDLFYFQVQNQEETEKWLNSLNRVRGKPAPASSQLSRSAALEDAAPASEDSAEEVAADAEAEPVDNAAAPEESAVPES
jgi:hypothetical protein